MLECPAGRGKKAPGSAEASGVNGTAEGKLRGKGRFTIDDETFYGGCWDGETWNGFATPCFEHAEAMRRAKSRRQRA